MGGCEVWWARVTDASRLRHLLPDADLRRADGFCLQADRDRSVVAAALARLLLAGRLGVGPAEMVIDRTLGKPRLSWPTAALDFSVSHAGDQVGVAISDGAAVGVDLERLGRVGAAFTRIWVRKEAVVKAAGTGLATPMSSFEVSGPDQPPRLLSWPANPAMTAGCTLADLRPEPGYLAALAVFGAAGTVTERGGNALLAENAAIWS